MPSAYQRPRRGRVVLLAAAVAMYSSFLLLASPDAGTLDTRLAYTPRSAIQFLEGLSVGDRATYRVFAFADLGFIPIYAALLVTWFRFLRVRGALTLKPAFALVPAAIDVIETTAIALALGHAAMPAGLGWAMAIATPLKWLTVAAVAVAIVIGELRWFKAWRSRRVVLADID